MRILCLLIALTAGLSLLYGVQYYAGGPLRLAVTSEVYDLALSPDGTPLVPVMEKSTCGTSRTIGWCIP